MFQSLHLSHNGSLYLARLHGEADVADLVRDHRLETITSADGRFVVWFTSQRTIGLINRRAVTLLLAATNLAAREVPLLLGNVVVTGRDTSGELADLTDGQVRWLVDLELGALDEWVLGRRFARYRREQQRQSRAKEAARWEEAWWQASSS